MRDSIPSFGVSPLQNGKDYDQEKVFGATTAVMVMVIATSGARLDLGGKRGIRHGINYRTGHYGIHDQRTGVRC